MSQQSETSLLERLKIEREELVTKTSALFGALNSEGFESKVGELQYSLLKTQHTIMVAYVTVLGERISNLLKK